MYLSGRKEAMFKNVFKGIIVLFSIMFVVIMLALGSLIATGKLNSQTLDSIVKVFSGEVVEKEKIIEGSVIQEWMKLEEARKKQEETFKLREIEINTLISINAVKQIEIEKKEKELSLKEAQLKQNYEVELKALKDQKEAYKKQLEDERFKSNLKVFAKMEAIQILAIMKNMTNEEVALYLRQFKPALSAEIIDLFTKDNDFKVRVDKILRLPNPN